MTTRGYQVGLDWSRTGTYSAALEDVTPRVANEQNVVANWGRADQYTSSDMAAGRLTFSLLNHDQALSPQNPASPIYAANPVGTPGKLDKDGTPIFSGVLDEFRADSAAAAQFEAGVADEWVRLGDFELSTTVYQGKRTGELIGVILDEVGWPVGARDLDPGVTLVPYWWAEGTKAGQAVLDLVHSDGEPAIAYVRNGVFVFRDRHHRVTQAASLTSQGIHSHVEPSGPIGTDFKIIKNSLTHDNGLERVINYALLEVAPVLPTTESVVWETEDPIYLGSFEQRVIFIQADDPFINLQIPTEDYKYTVPDKGFLEDFTIDSGGIDFTLSRTSGQSAIMTMTGQSSGGVITGGLRVRGTPLKAASTIKVTSEDPASQEKYGVLQWRDASAPWAYWYDAQALCDLMVSTYSTPQTSIIFDIEARLGDLTQARVLAAEISDRITVRVDPLGINTDFHIEKLTHSVLKIGAKHTLTIGAQVAAPVQAEVAFQFNVAGHGFNDGQFTAFAGNNPNTMFRFNTAGQGFNDGVFST